MKRVTVQLVLDVPSDSDAFDGINEILRETQRNWSPSSSLIDYAINDVVVDLHGMNPDEYEEGQAFSCPAPTGLHTAAGNALQALREAIQCSRGETTSNAGVWHAAALELSDALIALPTRPLMHRVNPGALTSVAMALEVAEQVDTARDVLIDRLRQLLPLATQLYWERSDDGHVPYAEMEMQSGREALVPTTCDPMDIFDRCEGRFSVWLRTTHGQRPADVEPNMFVNFLEAQLHCAAGTFGEIHQIVLALVHQVPNHVEHIDLRSPP